jgi:hypothetical protein
VIKFTCSSFNVFIRLACHLGSFRHTPTSPLLRPKTAESCLAPWLMTLVEGLTPLGLLIPPGPSITLDFLFFGLLFDFNCACLECAALILQHLDETLCAGIHKFPEFDGAT